MPGWEAQGSGFPRSAILPKGQAVDPKEAYAPLNQKTPGSLRKEVGPPRLHMETTQPAVMNRSSPAFLNKLRRCVYVLTHKQHGG